jgi:TolB-like protein/Tfp pilus assembly protein PilF
VALAFGWVFDISTAGIRRTQPVGSEEELLRSLPLRRADYVILTAFLVVLSAIVYDTTGRVLETAVSPAGEGEWRPSMAEVDANSVAVLPFTSLSADPEHEYFAAGISEEILDRLARFRELKVIARTSSFAFKDSGYDIARISGLLAVNYLLQGSVRRDGQQLRISAQLVDRSGVQVWSSSFDRALVGIFQLQDEIAEAVATSIVPQIISPPTSPRLPDLEAYQEYLAGREILASRRRPSAGQAMLRLDRAIELDPEFAEPYAERAVARILHSFHSLDAPVLDFEGAQADIDRALQLKPELGRAHAALGLLMLAREPLNREAREAALRRALALDPNQVDAWNWLSTVLDEQGRSEEATVALAQALRLDPLAPAPLVNMARREILAGNVAAGEEALLRGLASPLADEMQYGPLIFLNLARGRPAEALELGQSMVLHVAAETGRPPPLFALIGNNALLGRHDRALQYLQLNREKFPGALAMRAFELSYLSVDAGLLDRTEALSELQGLLPGGQPDIARAWPDTIGRYGELLALEGLPPACRRRAGGTLAYGVGRLVRGPFEPARRWRGLTCNPASRTRPTKCWPRCSRTMMLRSPPAKRDSSVRNPATSAAGWCGKARATLLLGDTDRALVLLEQAAREGWRGYYGASRDPRWAIVRDEPRFRAVMAWVKEDLDAQRAAFEATHSDEDFLARLDAIMAEHATRNPESASQ